jgi:hypothetical protein
MIDSNLRHYQRYSVKREKIKRKLQKAYIKSLSAFARGLIARGYELEDKVIELELKLKDK